MPSPTAPPASQKTALGTPTTPEEAYDIGRLLPPGLDGLRRLFRTCIERCDRDIALMRASDRWRPGQLDPEPYVPGDVPAMRATLAGTNLSVAAALLRRLGPERATSTELADDVLELVQLHVAAPMLVYEAAPSFVPAELALAVAASDRPPAGLVDDIRLPFPAVWIVFDHDLALPSDMAWPEGTPFGVAPLLRELAGPGLGAWQRSIAGGLHDRGGALCGVVVFAGADGVGLADEIVWTVSANPDPAMPPPQHLDRQRGSLPGARSRALLAPSIENLALLVATPWVDTPPRAPGIGEPGTERWARHHASRRATDSAIGAKWPGDAAARPAWPLAPLPGGDEGRRGADRRRRARGTRHRLALCRALHPAELHPSRAGRRSHPGLAPRAADRSVAGATGRRDRLIDRGRSDRSKGYTADGKRISAMTHARRSWTCVCGKEVSGNGGRSSHQRACTVYMSEMLAIHERMLAELISGERRGSEALINRHGHEVDVLTERIAARARSIHLPPG